MGGFDEELSVGEDIDLCWRLQLAGFRFALESGAVVFKREPTGFGEVFRQAFAYGRCGPVLYRRYRAVGARPRPDRRGQVLALAAPPLAAPGDEPDRTVTSGHAPPACGSVGSPAP